MKLAITAKKVVILMMTLALGVAMVACEGAVGKPGEPGKAGKPGETPKLAPVIKTPFEPVMLMVEGDAAGPIDVSAHFYDPEGETLTYTVAVDSAEDAVTVELTTEGMLTITPVAEGSATITVTATDPDDKSTPASFKVTVAPEGKMPPVTVGTIDPVALDVGDIVTIKDIDKYFSEDEDEALTYTFAVSPALVITVDLTDTTLTIRGDAYGTATVTVTATDEDGLTATQEIDVTVEVPGPAAPDPVKPTIVKAIPDKTLYKDDGDYDIVLSEHFTHERAITYEVSVIGDEVEADEVDGTLTLEPVVKGQAKVTVTATADELSVSESFFVTVEDGSAPDVTPEPPAAPAAAGEIPAQEVEVGKSKDVNVSMYFTPATGLTYTAESSAEGKATAEPSGSSSIKITGVAVGSATVTVTATDSETPPREATQTISVKVIAAGAEYKPSTVTIPGKGKTVDISIDDGQTLRSLDEDIVTVSGSGTTWTLRGNRKGEASVRIVNSDDTEEKLISVKVANSPPVIGTKPSIVLVLGSDTVTKAGASLATVISNGDNIARAYHKLAATPATNLLVPDTAFSDPDGAADIAKYIVTSDEPFVKVVNKDGELKTGPDLVLDVTKKLSGNFSLKVIAVDKSGAKSSAITRYVSFIIPHADLYEIAQDSGSTSMVINNVWRRQGDVVHTLDFSAYGANDAGFNFVKLFRDGLTEAAAHSTFAESHSTSVSINPTTDPTKTDPPTTASHHYKVAATGAVKLANATQDDTAKKGLSFDSSKPKLKFTIGGDSSSGTITITYWVTLDLDGAGTGTALGWRKKTLTMTMNIVPSENAYK